MCDVMQGDANGHTGLLVEGWQPAKKASFMPLSETQCMPRRRLNSL
jgi:hypothetical protein